MLSLCTALPLSEYESVSEVAVSMAQSSPKKSASSGDVEMNHLGQDNGIDRVSQAVGYKKRTWPLIETTSSSPGFPVLSLIHHSLTVIPSPHRRPFL